MNTVITEPSFGGSFGGPAGSPGGPGGFGINDPNDPNNPGAPGNPAGVDPVTGQPIPNSGNQFGAGGPSSGFGGSAGKAAPAVGDAAGMSPGIGGGAGDAVGSIAGGGGGGAGLLSGLTGAFDWKTLVQAALAIYGIHENQKPPKFYNVPPTPAEQWRTNASQQLYNFASGYTDQYIQGLGNLNPSFTMPNSLTGNPAFMGGVKVPTIDFSKVPTPSPTPPMSPPPSGNP